MCRRNSWGNCHHVWSIRNGCPKYVPMGLNVWWWKIGRLVILKTGDKIKYTNELTCEDYHIRICDIAARMNISISTAHDIVHEQLKFHTTAALKVPHELNSVHNLGSIYYLSGFQHLAEWWAKWVEVERNMRNKCKNLCRIQKQYYFC